MADGSRSAPPGPIGSRQPRVVVIGAGMAGLAAACDLARRGCAVTVAERAAAPGGKMRALDVGGAGALESRCVDGGPTVFTMRWVFDGLFEDAGDALDRRLDLIPAERLARHAWDPGEADDGPAGQTLDLYADPRRSADAIRDFAGPAEADRFRRFAARAARIYAAVEGPMIRGGKTSPLGVIGRLGPRGLAEALGATPLGTLWSALGRDFRDPRLRQLFARYATYCGSDPFRAPAVLMLVAHVERAGVWRISGGMARLAHALGALASRLGADIRYGADVDAILVKNDRAHGVALASGETLPADAVVAAGDVAAAADLVRETAGAGPGARRLPRTAPSDRSLSAVVWTARAAASGFPLSHHNVFFSRDYAREFREIFEARRAPTNPTVYVCAQDRDCAGARTDGAAPGAPERLQILTNAPALTPERAFDTKEADACETTTFALLTRCGLTIDRESWRAVRTDPTAFAALFPKTGGALYGRATHSMWDSFRRPGAATAIAGLYLASGSGHPGPGAPMAALSGRLAATQLLEDYASAKPRHRAVISGGMSTA